MNAKKWFLLGAFLYCVTYSYAQVRITQSAYDKKVSAENELKKLAEEKKAYTYDSTEMVIDKYSPDGFRKYIGQQIIIGPNERMESIHGFYLTPDVQGPVYKEVVINHHGYKFKETPMKEIGGKVFTISDIIPGSTTFAELTNEEDTIYFDFETYTYSYYIVGYIEKSAESFKNKKFALRMSTGTAIEYNTGEKINVVTGQEMQFVEAVINSRSGYLEYLFKDAKGKILGFTDLYEHGKISEVVEKSKSDSWRKKYGDYCWKEIMSYSIYKGMPESALILSWGEPERINTASYGSQWVYNGRYVYVSNGKVKSWN